MVHERLAVAPPWIQGLFAWISAAAGMTVFLVLFGRFGLPHIDTWGTALRRSLLAAISGSAGIGLGVALRSQGRRERSGVASLPAPERREALRAAAGGAVPRDSHVREAAWRHADDLIRSLVRQRPTALIIGGVLVAAWAILAAVTHSVALLPVLAVLVPAGPLSNEMQIRQVRRSAARLTD